MQKSLPSDMDKECIVLCEAMNRLSGVRTVDSCCGHGKHRFRIYFAVDPFEALVPLLYWFDNWRFGAMGWRKYSTDSFRYPAYFFVEGPIGTKAYETAGIIAGLLTDYVEKGEDPDLIWEE